MRALEAIAALLVVTLVACVQQTPYRVLTADRQAAKDAMRAVVECGRQHVSEVDDRISDASTVALALALRCYSEYVASGEGWAAAYLNNENQRRLFRKRLSGKSARIEVFLPIVMKYRTSADSTPVLIAYKNCVIDWVGENLIPDATPNEMAEGGQAACLDKLQEFEEAYKAELLSIAPRGQEMRAFEEAKSLASDIREMTKAHIIQLIIESRSANPAR